MFQCVPSLIKNNCIRNGKVLKRGEYLCHSEWGISVWRLFLLPQVRHDNSVKQDLMFAPNLIVERAFIHLLEFMPFFKNLVQGLFSQLASQWVIKGRSSQRSLVRWWTSRPVWKINPCRWCTEGLLLLYLVHLSPLAAVQYFKMHNTTPARSCVLRVDCYTASPNSLIPWNGL